MFRRRQSTPAPIIQAGSLLSQRYRLKEQLGRGGAGVIFMAEDEQLKRIVAIKLLTTDGGMAADKLERFRSEARSVARLNHPNIITLFDYSETNGQPYLVIEYIPGQDLWQFDTGYSPDLMPLDVALPIIDGVLAALEYSHRQQVIHRDLKPENIMITPEMQVKVMDFGLARIEGQSRLTEEGLVAGTASYLAPELALGEPGDHRVDLYAHGIIMYELFTGRRPFSGDDPLTIISQHIHAPVVPPQRYNPNLSDDLQSIVLKLTAKDPEDRYATATQVREALVPILARLQGGELVPAVTTVMKQRLAIESSTTQQTLLDRISHGKMLGRETELVELKRRWDLARLGEPGNEPLILISGESGIGKTRLLREFQVYTGLRDGYILYGRARKEQTGMPYALFADALRSYVRDQSSEVLRRQSPGFIAAEIVKLAPQLPEKIGYIPPNPPLEPEAERARLLEQVSHFLLNMAQEQPTLLLLDDLHFTDPDSLDMLSTVVRQAAGTALLIAGAYRDVALSYSNPVNSLVFSLEAAKLAYRIPLRRLPEPVVGQMLEALLGETVSQEFLNSIYQATEGNPLFVEEVIKGLATDGQIVLREGRWTQRDSDQVHVPGSIKSVLGGRLKRVKKSTLELLQLAAVVGRNFTLDMLSAASPHDDETIQYGIEEALRFQLIEVDKIVDQPVNAATGRINVHYQFQHALIRETLYEELRPLRRRKLHRKVAEAMEALVEEGAADLTPAVLAYHLIAAAQDEKAVPFLREAGELACQVYANAEAVEYLEQAREILEDVAVDLIDEALDDNLLNQFELLRRERSILNLMGDSERELPVLEKFLAVAELLRDKQCQVEAMSRLANYYWRVGKLNQAEEIAREGLEVAQAYDDREGEQHCLEQIARVLWTRRDAASMTYAAQALTIAQDLDNRLHEGRLTELVGQIYTGTLHDPNRATIYFEQALRICRETGNRIEEAWTLWSIGGLALFVDDYTRALDHYDEARKISEDIGATLQVGWDLYHSGDAWLNLGNYERATAGYEQSQLIFNTAHHTRGKIYTLISLGLVFLVKGNLEEAGLYLEQARRQAEERSDRVLIFRSYEALSAYYRVLGGEENLTSAIRLSNRIIKEAQGNDYFEHELLGYYLRGAGFLALGDLDEALNGSNVAVDALDRLTYLHSPQITAAEIYYVHSQILTALGQTTAAQTYLEVAQSETQRKAVLIADPQLRQDFLNQVALNREILSA